MDRPATPLKPKTRNRFRLLASYLRGRDECPCLPIFVAISSTSRCNLRCPMCPRAISSFSNKDMDFDLFRKIVDEGESHFECVVPYGGGEPLLNPRLFDMVRYCRDMGIHTLLSTNATLLDEAKTEAMLDSGLDYVLFAFDGATPEVYERYRVGASFQEVRANILHFLKRKVERKSKVIAAVQMVRLPGNKDQIADFKKMWKLPGVNDVRIKEDEICIDGVCLEEKKRGRPRRKNPCFFLWQGPLYIEENGDVFPCCHAWRSEPVGNVRGSSLMGIWNNVAMRAMRRAHRSGDISAFPVCAACRAPRPRLPLILGSFMVEALRVRKLIPFLERLSLLYGVSFFEDRR